MKSRVLNAAVELSRETHYQQVTRGQVAARAECGAGTINFHFGSMDGLRDAVVAEGVRTGDTVLVAQGIVSKHPITAGLTVRVE